MRLAMPPKIKQVDKIKEPSKERWCDGKTNLGTHEDVAIMAAKAFSVKYKKGYGVYKCPHCGGHHLTTKLHKKDEYKELLYSTVDNIQN